MDGIIYLVKNKTISQSENCSGVPILPNSSCRGGGRTYDRGHSKKFRQRKVVARQATAGIPPTRRRPAMQLDDASWPD